MEQSILNSIKKVLGIAPDYVAFDEDVMMFTNTAFSNLTQLGAGPPVFRIEDDTAEWSEFSEDDVLTDMVKTYVWLQVKMLFDPPNTGYLVTASQEQLNRLEWRINTYREGLEYTDPEVVA